MSHSHCLTVREGDKKSVRAWGERKSMVKPTTGGEGIVVQSHQNELNDLQSWTSSAKLTLYGTEAPTLVFAVVVGGGTPQVTVLTPDTCAAVEPLAIVQEGQIAGSAVRVPLDCVDLCGVKTDFKIPACGRRDRSTLWLWTVLNWKSSFVFSATCAIKHTVKTEDFVTVK